MDNELFSINDIADKLKCHETCIRSYLDRAEFNKYRHKSSLNKTRFETPPEMMNRLKELLYSRRCGKIY